MIERRIERFGLRMKPGIDFEMINPEHDERYREYWMEYYRLTERRGVSQAYAKIEMRRRLTLIGAMMIHRGEADGMLCGTFGTHDAAPALHRPGDRPAPRRQQLLRDERADAAEAHRVHLRHLREPRSRRRSSSPRSRCSPPRRSAASASTPKVALLSHSSFGTSIASAAKKMQAALALINAMDPDLEVEGEMHGDAALSEEVRLAGVSRIRG